MKNVSMTINSINVQSFATVPAAPAPPSPFSAPPSLVQEYSVAFNVKFESEDDAIDFAARMLRNIQEFKFRNEPSLMDQMSNILNKNNKFVD